MRVSLTANGRPRQAYDVWEGEAAGQAEGLADYAEQRAAYGGRGTDDGEGASLQDARQRSARPGVAPGGAWGRSAKGAGSRTGEGTELSPIQQAFIDAGAVQCGFRPPGPPATSAAARCTGYEKILDAVRLAAARQERQEHQEEAV